MDERLATAQILKKRNLSPAEVRVGKESAIYILKEAGLTYPDGGTFTESEFREAFGRDFPEIFDALRKDGLFVVVEKEMERSVKYGGPSGDVFTLNPWIEQGIHSELLEYGNAPGILKSSSPEKQIAELTGIIEESFKDAELLKARISELEGEASSLYRDIVSKRGDVRVQRLEESGGFHIVSDGAEALKNDIEIIESAKKLCSGYTAPQLEAALKVLESADVSDKFYRGKPPLTMKQSRTKSGADYLLKEISRKVFIPQELTRGDVEKYLKEWKGLQSK